MPLKDSIRRGNEGNSGRQYRGGLQEAGGPPTDPPVNIEVVGDNFENIASVAPQLYNFLDTNRVEGVENLQPDVDLNNPEINDQYRQATRAMMEGVTTAQLGMEIRAAISGREVSKIKQEKKNIKSRFGIPNCCGTMLPDLMNMRIIFMDMRIPCRVKSLPLSALLQNWLHKHYRGRKEKKCETYRSSYKVMYWTLRWLNPINAELKSKIDEFKSKSKNSRPMSP